MLVVGAGPAGRVAAVTLARAGIETLVVEKRPDRSQLPRATGASTSTMELMRAWGLEPQVREAVAAVVPDKAVRALVLGSDVTATPIALVEGKLVAFGCEPHNCGPHNWAVAIRPDGTGAAVCLYDQDRRVARWYPEKAGPAPVNGCPSGE